MGPVTALAGVCLQDVEGAHEGGKRLLASRLRPVSSKATHPPTYLPLHTGAPLVPVTFLVVDDLSVPVILGCTFTDDNAHAVLPQDLSVRWTDGSVTAVLPWPLDDGDRSMGVLCVLSSTCKTRLPPSAASVV